MCRGFGCADILETRDYVCFVHGDWYAVIDAAKWDADLERDASEFDARIIGSCWSRWG
jgi:hypothetical protein